MWQPEQTEEGIDMVWTGPETGIAPSALKGTANIQNANIATESGQVLASFGRTNQAQQAIAAGTLTPDGATLFNAPANLLAGAWVKILSSTVTSIVVPTNPTTIAIDYLAVGGGGGGGPADVSGAAGAGGAGRFMVGSPTIAVGKYNITIGAAGAGGFFAPAGDLGRGGDGGTTIISTVATAVGGGGGGIGIGNISPSTGLNGKPGASGGGGGAGAVGFQGTGGVATNGFDGGIGHQNVTAINRAGGGGGGSSAVGQAATGAFGGNGGAGTSSSITGTAVLYAGGGGGGGDSTQGAGAAGGGDGGNNAAGVAATANRGSGGGGASTNQNFNYSGGAGSTGVAIISYVTGAAYCIGGDVTYTATNTVHTFTEDGAFEVLAIPTGGLYYVSFKDEATGQIKLSSAFDPYGTSVITHGITGTISFDTLATIDAPIAKAREVYQTATTTEYRYYLLDANSRVWVYDTLVYSTTLASDGIGTTWMLPDPTDYTNAPLLGMNILNGWLILISDNFILCKPTVLLGISAFHLDGGYVTNPYHRKFAYVGSQAKLYYTDGNYIGEIFATNSLITSIANLQSYAEYTATTTTGVIDILIGGSVPAAIDGSRVPVVFFAAAGGTIPTALTTNQIYYLAYSLEQDGFQVYTSTSTTSSPLDIATGATGKQYFNTFYPVGQFAGSTSTTPTLQFTSQRVNLPFYETAQCLVEIDNNVIIGCASNTIYPWNQVDATPSNVVTLPEGDVKTMLNVNNMAYVFAGNKGNIYITNTVVASLVLKIPDYTAGVPGTPNSYIEPTFTWGDAIFGRGRVYCSILDQTATKAGNCGGVWSFIPSENVDPSQEVGRALRLENQNSYGDYDGYAPMMINNIDQAGKGFKYWAAWQDGHDAGTANFGIDYSTDNPVTSFVIETDLIRTGTFLTQETFEQLEYKLAVPLAAGDSVQLYWRINPTAAWTSAGTVRLETANPISGWYDVNFQKTQWTQIRAEITTNGTESSSYVPLVEIRLR